MKIVITGSNKIESLPTEAIERLNKIIELKAEVLIGDNYSTESLVQNYLKQQKYTNVKVYYVGDRPRNNAGFQSYKVPQAEIYCHRRPGRRGNGHLARERYLCELADYGLVVVNPGTQELMGTCRYMDANKVRIVLIANG